jgi:hypothetical protein
LGSVDESVGNLAHGCQVALGILEVLEALGVARLDAALDEAVERPLVLKPLLDLGVDGGLLLLLRSLGSRLGRSSLG